MNGHKSKFVKVSEDVEIDEEFIPVIKALNKVGLKTVECCQGGHTVDDKKHGGKRLIKGNRNSAYIAFDFNRISEVTFNHNQAGGATEVVIWWDRS